MGEMVQEGRQGNVEFQAVWRVRVSPRRWHVSKERELNQTVSSEGSLQREVKPLKWRHQRKTVNIVK